MGLTPPVFNQARERLAIEFKLFSALWETVRLSQLNNVNPVQQVWY